MNEANENTASTPPAAGPAAVTEPEAEDAGGPGIFVELGRLPPATVVSEDGLAVLLGKKCRDSVKRAVERGELPPGIKIAGKHCWTVGFLVRFLETRLEAEARKVTRLRVG